MPNLYGLKYRLMLLRQISTRRYNGLAIPLERSTLGDVLHNAQSIRDIAPVANANMFSLLGPWLSTDRASEVANLGVLTRGNSSERINSSELDTGQLLYIISYS